MSVINNPGSNSNGAIQVNSTTVVTPFDANILVNGVSPDGVIEVNGVPVACNKPVMVPTAGNPLTAVRSANTIYYNNTGYTMFICAYVNTSGGNVLMKAITDASSTPSTVVASGTGTNAVNGGFALIFFVAPGNYYEVTNASGTGVIVYWWEFICQVGTVTDSGDLSGSRSLSTIYRNNSPKTMFVSIQTTGVSANSATQGFSDQNPNPATQVETISQTSSGSGNVTAFFIVLPYQYYKVTAASGSISKWHEYTWDIRCTRSPDLVAVTATRTMVGSAVTFNTGTTTSSIFSIPVYINSNPYGVRWLQIINQNGSSSNASILCTGESWRPDLYLSDVYHVTGAVPRTLKGPVMPCQFYSAIDVTNGVLTVQHWYEYQLG